jgi:hypothetical protein
MNKNKMNKPKLFISLPCYDAMVTMQTMMSVLHLTNLLNKEQIEFTIDFIGNESLIPRARNNSLGRFMNSKFTHLLFIDADIEFPANAVMDLLQGNKDVACCAYAKKSYNWNRFMFSMNTEQNSKESFDSRGLDFTFNAEYDDTGNPIIDGNYMKVKHAATGFMLIQRSILEKLYIKHTELAITTDDISSFGNSIIGLFCCSIKDKQYLSEDYSFCERVREIGGSVWINTNHNLNHIGKHVFKSDLKNRQNKIRTQKDIMFYKQ